MDMKKVKAVVFDLDGTLLDTVKDLGAGANIALRRNGYPEHPLSAYPAFIGHGIRQLFRQLVPEGISEESFEDTLGFYLSYYPEHCTDLTDPFPGIPELLTLLEEKGYQMAILSNKTETTTRLIVNHYFPNVPFRFVWGGNGVRPLKPATDAAVLVCEELKLEPSEILFFGDGDTDMEFGSKSGFVTVGCSWGYRSVEQLKAAGAHEIVYSVDELLELLALK